MGRYIDGEWVECCLCRHINGDEDSDVSCLVEGGSDSCVAGGPYSKFQGWTEEELKVWEATKCKSP